MPPFNNKYELVEQLATSTTKTVWKAYDTLQGRPVALKLYHHVQKYDLDTLVRAEAAALTRVRHHPNVAEIYDANNDQKTGQFFIAEEYAEGETLAHWLATRTSMNPSRLRRLRSITRDILRGVDHIHRAGLVHGDLKLENILLTPTGAKITDFGSSVMKGQSVSTGALRYHAPELIKDGTRTSASDIWQVGILMYRATTGRFPFGIPEEMWERIPADKKGTYRDAVHRQIIEQHVIDPRAYNSDISRRMRNTILSCLEKDPAKRPSARKARWMLRPYWMYEATGLGLLLGPVLAFTLWNFWLSKPETPERIYYTSRMSGNAELYWMDVDGKTRTRLTDNLVDDTSITCTREGLLAYVTGSEGARSLLLRHPAAKEQKIISASSISTPVWSPEEQRLAAFTSTNGLDTLRIFDRQGNALSQTRCQQGVDLQWHPNGDYLSFVKAGRLYFVRPGVGVRQADEYPEHVISHAWTSRGLLIALHNPEPGELLLIRGTQARYERHTITDREQREPIDATTIRPLLNDAGYWYISHGAFFERTWDSKEARGINLNDGLPTMERAVVSAAEGKPGEYFLVARKDDLDGSGTLDRRDQSVYKLTLKGSGSEIVHYPGIHSAEEILFKR
ncbi:protein kinase [Candidatus Woesearchaeota archaeon]|nr:protein kinase [Candidatus Woesearchaeota archaeon]